MGIVGDGQDITPIQDIMDNKEDVHRDDYKDDWWKPEWGFHNLMVIAAFRYCLGRRSYIVSSCVDWLIQWWDQFHENDRKIILEETRDAINKGYAGDACDIDSWERLLRHAIPIALPEPVNHIPDATKMIEIPP